MPEGIVISLEVLVIGMGYRGSKSIIYASVPSPLTLRSRGKENKLLL